jgi:hypothetical protein
MTSINTDYLGRAMASAYYVPASHWRLEGAGAGESGLSISAYILVVGLQRAALEGSWHLSYADEFNL